MKRLVFKSENLLVDVLDEYEVAGIKRFKVRDAKNNKTDVRTVLESSLREPTEDDIEHVVFLYQDEETGEVHTIKLMKEFISAIPRHLGVGRLCAVTAKAVLGLMGKEDTDTMRRQFRAAVAYWIEKGIVICSTTSGYFIAETGSEVQSCVEHKERQARANLRRAEYLRGMDVEKSTTIFRQQQVSAVA